MAKWREHLRGGHGKPTQPKEEDKASADCYETSSDCYDLPCGMSFIRRWTLFKFVPFCPTFLVDVKPGQVAAADDGEVAGDVEGAVVTARL